MSTYPGKPSHGLVAGATPISRCVEQHYEGQADTRYLRRIPVIQNPQATVNRRRKQARVIPTTPRVPAAFTCQPLPPHPLILTTSTRCSKCHAKKFQFETKKFCCGDGDVQLASNDYPLELTRLFTSTDKDAKHFRRYARLYNNLFAFSSIGGKIDARTEKGIYVFRLHGQIYHHIPDLLPSDNDPKYLQLYFYDGQCEADNRLGCFPELQRNIIDILMNVMQRNPYAKFFRSLKDIDVVESTQIVINKNPCVNQAVSNAPTSDEVAVIWPDGTDSSASSGPHIIATGRSNKTDRIKHYYGCYDPLQYPLLLPLGESGWQQGILKASSPGEVSTEEIPEITAYASSTDALLNLEAQRASQPTIRGQRHVSCREYYCYKLQQRPRNLLLRGGRCLQQYIVDMYVKVENTRLDFFRDHQDTIRADLYQGILDTIDCGENCAANVGRRVILPPTFIGGPRDMKKRYLNAMALVHRYGKPDLFLTITCNSNWPEIKQELVKGELAHNRPDLLTRIFRAKLMALKRKIMHDHVFGEVAAMVYVVEFQKRGLPHAHFLIILKPTFKIKDPTDYDKYVSAEIPPMSKQNLRNIVLKHMMHGPCGLLDPKCPCMGHKKPLGKCKYGYPKKFTEVTSSSMDGYPTYKRRNSGERVLVRKHHLNNQWVIPYNPYLLATFDCHLNVEICSSITAVKYLYKYVYKGHDKISFNVQQTTGEDAVNEITRFQTGRWVSPCEAAWRLFGFDLFEMHPPVMPLPVHLPNMQTIQLRSKEQLTDVVACGQRTRTPLTEYFNTNNTTNGGGLLYGEFTEHYRWDTSSKRWFKRKNKLLMIGRLVFVSPSEGERYFLRMLLLHVRNAKSFDDLMTVDGYKCASFQEAALKLRLLEEDGAIDLCLSEAAAIQMPFALRRLFATVLIFCQANDPVNLWSKYYSALSDDYMHQFPLNPQKVLRLTVRNVEQCLESMGKSLKTFGLDQLVGQEDEELRRTRDIIDAPIPQESIDCIGMLNEAQQTAFDAIMSCINGGGGGAFFVDGPGGSGKTFLYNALYAKVRMMGKIVLPTATSGIAAANLPSGRTMHSRMKIPLDSDSSLSCDVPKQSSLAALIRETSLIIWDEASMARKENVESVDSLLRDLCNPLLLFGGKTIVFGGDFRQVLPILPRKSQKEAVLVSLVSSIIWPKLKKFRLTVNVRAKADPLYADFLLALGNGELQSEGNALVQLPPQVIKYDELVPDPVGQIISFAFPELGVCSFNPDIFTGRAILTPMNDDVDSINSNLISKFPGAMTTYMSFDTILDDNCNIYPSEFINSLCPGGMSPHELVLKEDCPVILLRNLSPAHGLCNGTRLLCKHFTPNLIECMITTGQHTGEHVFIPRINLRPAASSNYPFQFQRKQFPLKLSFAMTINKSQGQTLDSVAIYLPRPCFSHGQLYVALSRAKKAGNVAVLSKSPIDGSSGRYVQNVVSYDVLRLAGVI